MAENRTEPPAWHTKPWVHNSCLSWHQRFARCRKKEGCALLSSQKSCFGKLSQSSFSNQCYTAATEAVTVQRVVHSGCSGPGLCSEDGPGQSDGPKLPELMPSDLHCCYLSQGTKSTIASLTPNTICGCVDKLQNMWEEQNLSLRDKTQVVHCQHQSPFSEGKTPTGGVILKCPAQSGALAAGRTGCTQRPGRNPLHTNLLGKFQEDRRYVSYFSSLGDNANSDQAND